MVPVRRPLAGGLRGGHGAAGRAGLDARGHPRVGAAGRPRRARHLVSPSESANRRSPMAHSTQHTVVSVDRVIDAPAASLFAVVADANRHTEIDGSGALVGTKAGAPHELALGSTFGMSMKLGVPYSMSNTVIEFEQDRRIAWQTVLAGPLGRFIGGRIWRYEFEPVDGGTKVTESWDISQDKQVFFLKHGKVGQQTATSMSKTLDRLAAITEGAGA